MYQLTQAYQCPICGTQIYTLAGKVRQSKIWIDDDCPYPANVTFIKHLMK